MNVTDDRNKLKFINHRKHKNVSHWSGYMALNRVFRFVRLKWNEHFCAPKLWPLGCNEHWFIYNERTKFNTHHFHVPNSL